MLRRLCLLAVAVAAIPASLAQVPDAATAPPAFEVLAVNVEGVPSESQQLAISISGLRAGQKVQLPWDPRFGEAVRNLYNRGGYADAEVIASEVAGQGVFLTLRVTEQPRLLGYEIEGLKSGEKTEVKEEVPLLRGRPVRPSDVERGRLAIERYVRQKGFRLATVTASQATTPEGQINVTYLVDRGRRLGISEVAFEGNTAFSDATLRRQLKNTPERRWWRFWKRETFSDDKFDEDLQALVRFYNDNGYYGARVVQDSVYTRPNEKGGDELAIQIRVDEGAQYHVRDVVFEGNTVYTDDQLRLALGVTEGEVYDRSKIEKGLGLAYSSDPTQIGSLYRDRGYLRFYAEPQVVEVALDSVDLYVELTEGDVYEFGDVTIAGNTRTKEHVIRRELRTVPGQTYSQNALERSVRELATLNYFDPTSIGGGPDVQIDEEGKQVDLTYNLVETSSDQLELSGGWGGGGTGLILTARVTFNNFSVQNLFNGGGPLPTGDGQQLSLQVQTYGTRQQVYSLSFTEPWFRGRQTPAGFSLGYSGYNYLGTDIARGFGRMFYRQRLKWPDDYFLTGSNVGFQLFDITTTSGTGLFNGLPDGISKEVTFQQTLSRNALDNPLFPSAGSDLSFGVTVAPPFPGFIQYHKWDFSSAFYTPLANRVSASVSTQFGYIGSITGDEVRFQRFLIGGTPLEASQGIASSFGKDQVFLRGYPLNAIGPRLDGDPVGGRILNKYQAELQWVAVQSPQLSAAPYLFADAANTWNGFDDFDPSRLYRSAGVGTRLFLPILGLVDLSYGYQIDAFQPLPNAGDDGQPRWRFQFSLGGR